jgi:hypothetical protein
MKNDQIYMTISFKFWMESHDIEQNYLKGSNFSVSTPFDTILSRPL